MEIISIPYHADANEYQPWINVSVTSPIGSQRVWPRDTYTLEMEIRR